jgi:L-2,4-diaminobutyrate decarboxylase
MMDEKFLPDKELLVKAVSLLCEEIPAGRADRVSSNFPVDGMDSSEVIDLLAPQILADAAKLGAPTSIAHMDPPTPTIAWAVSLWNAALNQNLLHPATAPFALEAEKTVIKWLAPLFGMTGGHMTSGSTVANLTALWAAREQANVEQIVMSDKAHLSLEKAANILGLPVLKIGTGSDGKLLVNKLPDDLSRSVLVLNAGMTSTGMIDPLEAIGIAKWTHVDGAWAAPMIFTKYAERLKGIELADSISISAHKWLFQPKDSAMVLFRDNESASNSISFGADYLNEPNIGVLGSRGAKGVLLLATILSFGKRGLAQRIEGCVRNSEILSHFVANDMRLNLFANPETAVVVWRPSEPDYFDLVLNGLPEGSVSTTRLDGDLWFRNVFANPNADVETYLARLEEILKKLSTL